MDYTTIDPDSVADEVIADRHAQAADQAANLALDAARIEFCQVLRAVANKDADPVLDSEAAKLAEQATVASADVDRLAAKLDAVPDRTDRRREWLDAYVGQVEREHAAHGALAKLATEAGDDAQAEQHVMAQLVCEGAHAAALAERADLDGKGEAAAEVKPVKR